MKSHFKQRINEFCDLRDQPENDREQNFYMSPFDKRTVYDRSSDNQSYKSYRNSSTCRNAHRSLKNKPLSSSRNGDNNHNFANASNYVRYNEYVDKCRTPTKIHSRNASVQVSCEDFQRFRTLNDCSWYDDHNNLNNFTENEDILDTCKYCKKPLSASDFELEVNDTIYQSLERDHSFDFKDMDSKCSKSYCSNSLKGGSKSMNIDMRPSNYCNFRLNSFNTQPEVFFHGPYYSYNSRAPIYLKDTLPIVHSKRNMSCQQSLVQDAASYCQNNIPYDEHFNPSFNDASFADKFQCFCDRCLEISKRRRQAFERTCEYQSFSEPNMHGNGNPNYEHSDMCDYGCYCNKKSCNQVICQNRAYHAHSSLSFSPRHYSQNDSRWKLNSEKIFHQGQQSNHDKEPNNDDKNNIYLLCIDKNLPTKMNATKSNCNHTKELSSDPSQNFVSKPRTSLSKCTCEAKSSYVKSSEEKTSNIRNSVETAIENLSPSTPVFLKDYEMSPKENLEEDILIKQEDTSSLPMKVTNNESTKYSIEDVCKIAFRYKEDSDPRHEVLDSGALNSQLLSQIKKGSNKNPVVLILEADRSVTKMRELTKYPVQNDLEKSPTSSDQSATQHPQVKPSSPQRRDEASSNLSNLNSPLLKGKENCQAVQSKSNSQEKNSKNIKNTMLKKTSENNIQKRFRNPEVQNNVYSNAENVLKEMKEVLKGKGKWSGI